MTEQNFNLFIGIWIAIAIVTFIFLLKVTAPYGRHTKTNWGLLIDNKLGWFIMEFFVLLVLFGFLYFGKNSVSLVSGVIVSLFTIHYLNRSIVFPLRIKTNGKKMPVVIVLSALGFNLINGFLLGYYIANFATYTTAWFSSPQFIIGTILFFAGMFINIQSDNILINLRKPNETGYKIPQQGLFRYVSCPNLFGEMLEWFGFAVLMWSLPGLAFFVWTVANLLPRALSHHKWYLDKFSDYPKDRKAVLPFIL
jgi:3-oxo-5-alpha-steroid 4-dehydrogenase 1